ncbi:MAG: lytic transglycosylase domain-containing protein [Acidobacteriaceae bacterium]|nr:lytic transglycosylase domain-containing protein [Acidobacteriaceae bacterium]
MIFRVRLWWIPLVLTLAPLPSPSAECVYFSSGFTMDVESHTENGSTFILKTSSGSIELPAGEILKIVPLPAAAAVPPQQQKVHKPDAIATAALNEGLEVEFVRSVAKIESNLQQNAVSRKGALGVMQLMPSTAGTLGVNARDESENAEGGAKYLRQLLIKYHGDSALALAAYNAGPGAVAKFKGVPPYAETRAYVLRVLREYAKESRAAKAKPNAASASSSPNKPNATD